jgi:hypothetical protein
METEFKEILVCSNSFVISDELSSDVLSQIEANAPMFYSSDGQLGIERFTRIPYMRFMTELAALRDTLKNANIKLSDNIIAVLFNDDNETTEVQIKTGIKQIKCTTGSIKCSFTKDDAKPKPKALTLDEKLKLVAEWHTQHPTEKPNTKTVHKNFKLGKFVEKSEKDAQVKIQVDAILNEN